MEFLNTTNTTQNSLIKRQRRHNYVIWIFGVRRCFFCILYTYHEFDRVIRMVSATVSVFGLSTAGQSTHTGVMRCNRREYE